MPTARTEDASVTASCCAPQRAQGAPEPDDSPRELAFDAADSRAVGCPCGEDCPCGPGCGC